MTEPLQHEPPLHRRLRDARRARGMTQSELADQAGCKQSAVSMLESGRLEALARPTVARIAALLGVELGAELAAEAPAGGAPAALAAPPPGRACCPNGACPSNVPFVVAGEVIFWPRRQPTAGGRHCAYCGEVLERLCRHCGAPVSEGACCPACGTPRVPAPPAAGDDPEGWAEARRRQIAEWRSLL